MLDYSRLAWLLATCSEEKVRDGMYAIHLATRACEQTHWISGTELNILAAAYAEAGQFNEAECYQTKALEEAYNLGPERDEFRQRLELYKQRKPFREST